MVDFIAMDDMWLEYDPRNWRTWQLGRMATAGKRIAYRRPRHTTCGRWHGGLCTLETSVPSRQRYGEAQALALRYITRCEILSEALFFCLLLHSQASSSTTYRVSYHDCDSVQILPHTPIIIHLQGNREHDV